MPGFTTKLKASCDRCAADKVKCGKQHPSCARCMQANRDCVYGVSQRAGKPSQAKLALRRKLAASNASPSSTAPSSAASTSPHPSEPLDFEPLNAASPFWLSTDMMLPNLPWQDDLGIADMATLAQSPAYHDQSAMSTASTFFAALPGTTQCSLASSTALSSPELLIDASLDFPMSELTTPESSSRSSATRDMTGTCCDPSEVTKQLCDALELGQASSMTLDLLLREICGLSQKISNHLRCSCAKDCSVFMVLAASMCEIIVLYQAIAHVKPCNPESGARATSQLSLCRSELMLGSFKLDERMGSAVRDQLVLSQLHDMTEKWEQYISSLSHDRTKEADMKLLFVAANLVLSRLKYTVDEIESRRAPSSRGS